VHVHVVVMVHRRRGCDRVVVAEVVPAAWVRPPEPAHRPAPLPNAVEDGPPGFRADPPTQRQSTIEDEELMLQKRSPPIEVPRPAAMATDATANSSILLINYVNVDLF
jgi:hypothetical protein